jgi:hypothetical protein
MATLAANAVAPGLLDRYLGKTGFGSQQTGQPHDPKKPGNLFEPADGSDGEDYGAHGVFDDKAHDGDPQLWASHHHGVLVGVGAAALASTAALVRKWR